MYICLCVYIKLCICMYVWCHLYRSHAVQEDIQSKLFDQLSEKLKASERLLREEMAERVSYVLLTVAQCTSDHSAMVYVGYAR